MKYPYLQDGFERFSTKRAVSLWLTDEDEKGHLSSGSWSFSYQPE
jgi:hypothetical protein